MTRPLPIVALLSALALGIAVPSGAQTMKMNTDMSADAAASPSTQAFQAANTTMHHAMMIDYTGNTDVDFVRGMIPHHQGAIAMATVELQYGTDPEIRKLAEGIIKAQEAEIAEMQAWLAAHDKPSK